MKINYLIIILVVACASVSIVNAKSTNDIPKVTITPKDVIELVKSLKEMHMPSEFVNQVVLTELYDLANIEKYENPSLTKYKDAPIDVLIKKDGYTLEVHEVTTEDGYILTLHRIPNKNETAKPIFLFHGDLVSSNSWVCGSKENALPYFFISQGYDVWLGNARGNEYARKHKSLSPDCPEFWDFSFNEHAVYDLPAMVDYVLKETDRQTLTYLGYSQGAITELILLSEKPEYNEKFDKVFLMSGFSSLSHIKSPVLRALAEIHDIIYDLLKILGIYEISSVTSSNNFISSKFLRLIQDTLCGNTKLEKLLCSNLVFIITGYDLANLDIEYLPIMIGHLPTGSSIKNQNHYAQLVTSGKFRQYDYGEIKNVEIYNQKTPPEYNLANVKAPLHVFFSDSDWIFSVTDANICINQLTNVTSLTKHFIPNYNHLDWIMSKNLKTDIHPILEKLLNEYNTI